MQEASIHERPPAAAGAKDSPPSPLLLAVKLAADDALSPAAGVTTALLHDGLVVPHETA